MALASKVEIWNTFQEQKKTHGAETIFSFRTATIGDDVEFSLFPPNPPGAPEGGFYDINIRPDTVDPLKGTITWTLKDNRGAGHLVLPDGSYDRYYLVLEGAIASASVVEGSKLNPKVSVPAYEDKSDIKDFFKSGLKFPPVLGNNVILLEVQPGGDMTELEQTITVGYKLASSEKKVEKSSGVGAVSIWNTFEEVAKTGGKETIYSFRAASISDAVEFTRFPPNPPRTPEGGFYDIDIKLDSKDATKATITWTLQDNKGAGHLVVGVGSFDRYYLVFDQAVASASLVERANLNPKVTVPFYEETAVADLFKSGLPFPTVLENNIVLLEVQPGADMTELGQVIKVDITFESALVVGSSVSTGSGCPCVVM